MQQAADQRGLPPRQTAVAAAAATSPATPCRCRQLLACRMAAASITIVLQDWHWSCSGPALPAAAAGVPVPSAASVERSTRSASGAGQLHGSKRRRGGGLLIRQAHFMAAAAVPPAGTQQPRRPSARAQHPTTRSAHSPQHQPHADVAAASASQATHAHRGLLRTCRRAGCRSQRRSTRPRRPRHAGGRPARQTGHSRAGHRRPAEGGG